MLEYRDLEFNTCTTTPTETRAKASLKNYIDYYIKSKILSLHWKVNFCGCDGQLPSICDTPEVTQCFPPHATEVGLRNHTLTDCSQSLVVTKGWWELAAKAFILTKPSLKMTDNASRPPPSRSWAPVIGDREQWNHMSSKTLNGLNVWTITGWIMIIQVWVVLELTVVDSHWYFDNLYVLWLLEWHANDHYTGCPNDIHCRQQSYSGLDSPRGQYSSYFSHLNEVLCTSHILEGNDHRLPSHW